MYLVNDGQLMTEIIMPGNKLLRKIVRKSITVKQPPTSLQGFAMKSKVALFRLKTVGYIIFLIVTLTLRERIIKSVVILLTFIPIIPLY